MGIRTTREFSEKDVHDTLRKKVPFTGKLEKRRGNDLEKRKGPGPRAMDLDKDLARGG